MTSKSITRFLALVFLVILLVTLFPGAVPG